MSFAVVPAPPIVDPSNGNLLIPARSGLTIAVQMQDAAGGAIVLTESQLYFEVEGLLRIALTSGPDPYTRLIVLTDTAVAALPLNDALWFVLRDETAPSASTPWAGRIRTYGYSDMPA